MPTRHKKQTKIRSKHRASWRGQLRFGLVSFEVQAINAEIKENAEVHFDLLHAKDHERIHYAKICPQHGEVPNDEIVEGYEYTKGKYVEFDKAELDDLRSEREKALTIDAFIGSQDIDPIFFDGRMYYLIPAGSNSSEPYTLLVAAMEKKNRWGIGQVVFSGREQLAVIRPLGGVLTMAMLNYEAEIRKPSEINSEIKKVSTSPRKLRLAEELVGKWHDGKFDFSDYKDRYRQKVKQAIEAKAKGVRLPETEDDEPEVINLMDALQRSVARAGSNGSARHSKKGKPKGSRRNSYTGHRRQA